MQTKQEEKISELSQLIDQKITLLKNREKNQSSHIEKSEIKLNNFLNPVKTIQSEKKDQNILEKTINKEKHKSQLQLDKNPEKFLNKSQQNESVTQSFYKVYYYISE